VQTVDKESRQFTGHVTLLQYTYEQLSVTNFKAKPHGHLQSTDTKCLKSL